jgi:hypothetical protein
LPVTSPPSKHPIPNRRRSQRVLLRLPTLVIARGPDQQNASENAFTTNVSAHGALLALSMRVALNQKILIRNPDTLEEQFGRVVHVTHGAEGKLEVGVEFLKPAPKFWRISFPPTTGPPKSPKSPPTPSDATPRPVACYLLSDRCYPLSDYSLPFTKNPFLSSPHLTVRN